MLKKLISILSMGVAAATLCSCSVQSKTIFSDDYTFRVEKKGLVVKDYRIKNPVDVVIPEEFDGKPVIGLEGNLYSSNKLKGVESLETIELPNSITKIGDFCFTNCINLKSINIPTSMTRIGYYVLGGTGITNLVLPEGVTRIERYAFMKCKSLEYVILPNTLKSVDYDVFLYDDALEAIYYNGTAEEFKSIRFSSKAVSEKNNTKIGDLVSYYSETMPTGTGSYWHYVDNEPAKW